MEYHSGTSEIYTRTAPLSHLQGTEEQKWLSDHVPAYIGHVANPGLQINSADTSGFIRSTKNLDEEIVNLKNIYEAELEKLRKDLQVGARERTALQIQCNSQETNISELQSKLSVEMDKNRKLADEIVIQHQRIAELDSELQDTLNVMHKPMENLDHLRRCADNLSREVEQWKHRYEHEKLATQAMEKQLQQMVKKVEFSDLVHNQQIKYYQVRLDLASDTILNLEGHNQELNTHKVTVNELPNQVHSKTKSEPIIWESEPRKQHIANAADLQHRKKTLEEKIPTDLSQSAEIKQLMVKLRDVYDTLVLKMNVMDVTGESRNELKSEIDALKVLLEEEERRFQVPTSIVSMSTLQNTVSKTTCSDHAQPISSSETQQEKAIDNCKTIIGNSNNKGQAKCEGTGADFVTTTSTKLLTYLPAVTKAASAPIASFTTTGDDCSSNYPNASGLTSLLYPNEPSPPLNTFYIPEELRSAEAHMLASEVNVDAEQTESGLHLPGFLLPMTGPQYDYKTLDNRNQLQDYPSQPLTSHVIDPIQARAKSALEGVLHKAQTDTLISKPRPKSSPIETSLHQVSTDSTSSAIGDLKIQEVSNNGKFVRLLNDGPTEFEFGGYMIQQIVCGHPVAVYRFPPQTKFPPNSTITVWSAINDPNVHKPPLDFFWKEKDKWDTGPKCTTTLCRSKGEIVAWATAAHRFGIDAFQKDSTSKQDIEINDEKNDQFDGEDYIKEKDILTELKVDTNGPRPDPVYFRRVKKQLPSLIASKHPHGFSPMLNVHPSTGQPRPHHFGNDNSTSSRHSRTQTIRPDPISDLTNTSLQLIGSKTSRAIEGGQRAKSATFREKETPTKKLATNVGETCEGPSPFMRPHGRFERGVKQVCSQHHSDFLPPMPRISQTSW